MISPLLQDNALFKVKTALSYLFLSFILSSAGTAQVQVVKGGNMENKASWFIYNLNSTTPAATEFNHTAQKPAQGLNGCLRISATAPSNILFWQKITVKAGEVYAVDGAIRTNNVASFWAEISVGTVPPIEGVDYLPNNNGDVIEGFSTWTGCGPNVNGTFASNACTGKKSYVVPGANGTNVDVYFCFKVGSMASPLPNPLEVFVDELKMTRTTNTGNDLLSISFGTVQAATLVATVPFNVIAAQLKSAIVVSPYAIYKLVNASNNDVAANTVVDNSMKITVTSEGGVSKTYSITTSTTLSTETISNYTGIVNDYTNKKVDIDNSQITINSTDNPLKGSLLNLKGENVWLYFPNMRPSALQSKYLSQVMINGSPAVLDQNVRLEQYLQGTVVISHPSTYKALQVYSGDNLTATSLLFGNNTYQRAAQLGTLNNAVRSFRLKKGYMATFAQNEDGTGASQVYIAYDADVVINKLPSSLYDQVSFVRVVPWRWVAKKGWTNGQDAAQALNCHWNYDWNNEGTSIIDVEYVPMRHNANWNAYSNINNKLKSTHSLGFNEPDRVDQANMSVDAAVAAWPEMLKSGLRVGSPCPSDAGPALDWLYSFIDRCDQLNYRVDFVAVHWYKGGQTARQFYDWLKAINVRTKRPIWITEWNNGANWTCCKPTFAQQATTIGQMINMLDTASFVERYSLYEWVEDTRMMFLQSPISLTPAGIVYRDNPSPLAYNPKKVTTILTDIASENELERGEGISFYPNPIENTVYIKSERPILSAKIYSPLGALVATFPSITSNQLEVGNLPSGIYLLEVQDLLQKYRKKLIKK